MSAPPELVPWRAQPGPQLFAIQKHLVPELFFGGAVGGGKLLGLDAVLPTPVGWARVGDLAVGNTLFAEDGSPCRVTHLFPIESTPEMWRFVFDDGSQIESCIDHKWLTFDTTQLSQLTRQDPEWRARRRASRASRAKAVSQKPGVSANVTERNRQRAIGYESAPVTGTVRTTREIITTLNGGNGRNHAIPVAKPLQMPDADLPLDPYLLGVWLGDGTAATGQITGMDSEIFAAFAEHFEPGAVQCKEGNRAVQQTFYGLRLKLREMGVLNNKHVPAAYLRGSYAQRLALLQGLMDTDGTVAKASGSAEFCNTNERIIDAACEIIVSLGNKVTKREGRAKLAGRDYGPKWTLKWLPNEIVFRLPRKVALQKIAKRRTTKFRYIVSAERVESAPGRCLAVDSPSHLFLVGRQMVPTHNSDYLLGDFAQDVATYGSNWNGIIFRKSYPQLEELVARSKQMYPAWFGFSAKDCWTSGNHTWTFPNGAVLKFRHAEDEDSWMEYQGHAFGLIGYDELPHWSSPNYYNQMKTRLRNGGVPIPNKRIRSTGNPGGAGHGWIKQYFGIDRYPNGSVLLPKDKMGSARMFVKSSVRDNKILLANDPEYIERLQGLGSDALVQMYLAGDWNVIAGAFFPEFSTERHIVAPFEIPKGWMRFRSMDWGSAAPFSVGWYCVSDGSMPEHPRGKIIKYREWYGMKPGEYNVGLKLTAEEVAQGIRDREGKDEKFDMSVIDPSAFKEDGGPSIASRMGKLKVHFQKGDNQRKPGWDQVRARLKGDEDGRAMIGFFPNCADTIRTLPMLQHDTGKSAGAIEDVDTHSEDHAGDEVRYACMSRPWVKPGTPAPVKKVVSGQYTSTTTFNDLMEQRKRARLAEDA